MKRLFGEAHQNSKFTERQVSEIRRLRSSGMTCTEIAKLLGIEKYKSVWKIATGATWPHIGGIQPKVRRPITKDVEERKRRRLESARNWRARNPEKAKQVCRDSMKRRRTEHRDEYLATKRAWQAANQGKVRLHARRALCKKHGISLEIYERLLERQGGVCAICLGAEEQKNGLLCIDHDHTCCASTHSCGKCIRGLLCTKCNQGIGCLKESAKVLKAALSYLAIREKIWESGDHELSVV